MDDSTSLVRQVLEQARDLPEESLQELVTFVGYLRFRADNQSTGPEAACALQPVKLGGILRGYDFSPQLLAEVRRVIVHPCATRHGAEAACRADTDRPDRR